MIDQKTMPYEEQEGMRQVRLNEVGTEPPCPFCRRPTAEGKAERLRPVQPVRSELAGWGGSDEGPATESAGKECGACEGQLLAVRGKWVCVDPACGQEQGRVTT